MKDQLTRWAEADKTRILNLIPFFHGYYARTKNPEALEVARSLGIAAKNITSPC